MKMLHKIKITRFKHLHNIAIGSLAIVFAVGLFLLLPFRLEKYTLEILENKSHSTKLFAYFGADLDSDGYTETLRCKKDYSAPGITVETYKGEILGQWNLLGTWVERSPVEITDVDHDGYKEIVGFTYRSDSIYLNILEIMEKGGTMKTNIGILPVKLHNNNQDWFIQMAPPADLDGDNHDEIIFTVMAGFSLHPRKLISYNVVTNNLNVQQEKYGNNLKTLATIDLNNDNLPEITGSTYAPNNYGELPVELSDSCSYLLVYDKSLSFFTAPLPYCNFPSSLDVLPLTTKNKNMLVTCFRQKDLNTEKNELAVWEWENGELLKSHSIYYPDNELFYLINHMNVNVDYFYAIAKNEIRKYNEDLKIVERTKITPDLFLSNWYALDMDGDGKLEHIALSNSNKITIFRHNFRHPVQVHFELSPVRQLLSLSFSATERFLNVFDNGNFTVLAYQHNRLYNYRYVLFILFFVAFYLLFSFLFNYQRKRIEVKLASEKALLHYQLANVNQQIDPHFLFNAINNISHFYMSGNQEEAYYYTAKMSKLIRSTIENSENIAVSLAQEIDFVSHYLNLEKMRNDHAFSYQIDISEDRKRSVKLPKMLIQNFAENAVKHGIRPLKNRNGRIKIYSGSANGYLKISIEDNGIGRKAAVSHNTTGTGNGLQIIDRMLHLYEQLSGVKISYRIHDLVDNLNTPLGTRVDINIPK